MKKACSIEVLAVTLRSVIGSVDGLQGAVNESRNRSMETKTVVEEFANSCLEVFKLIAVRVPKLLGKQ